MVFERKDATGQESNPTAKFSIVGYENVLSHHTGGCIVMSGMDELARLFKLLKLLLSEPAGVLDALPSF